MMEIWISAASDESRKKALGFQKVIKVECVMAASLTKRFQDGI
jgi:hypothetical protein